AEGGILGVGGRAQATCGAALGLSVAGDPAKTDAARGATELTCRKTSRASAIDAPRAQVLDVEIAGASGPRRPSAGRRAAAGKGAAAPSCARTVAPARGGASPVSPVARAAPGGLRRVF